MASSCRQEIAGFCDVFTEEDVFTVEQSRRILEAGKGYGLNPKVRAEELTHLGGAKLAADIGAISADHLLHATSEDADALAGSRGNAGPSTWNRLLARRRIC